MCRCKCTGDKASMKASKLAPSAPPVESEDMLTVHKAINDFCGIGLCHLLKIQKLPE